MGPPPRVAWAAAALGLVAALAIPLVGTRDLVTAAFFTFLYVVLALNYDILGGFLGYMNLGQGAFFGLAAYVTVLLLNSAWLDRLGPADMPVAILIAAAVTAAVALAFAYPLFRLSGAYFAMATFAMVLLIRHLILNLPDLTGGSYGVYVSPRHYLSLPVAYALALGLLLASIALNRAIARSRLGLAVTAIRESELAASTIGLDLFRVKRRVLVLSAVPSALAGGVFGLQAGYIDVDAALGVDKTLLPVIMALMGGSGRVAGPVVGGLLVRGVDVVLKNYLHLTVPALAIYGLILLGIGLLLPEGLLNYAGRRRRWAGRPA
ncbi:MAG TPA: branched-chain amino acid ABC transporter permease [Methylomirabilota bacterium]|nr:branched-chain amino acid ABC transporter permease [Methylomirabilota bacterium]